MENKLNKICMLEHNERDQIYLKMCFHLCRRRSDFLIDFLHLQAPYYLFNLFLVYISQLPAYFSVQKMPLPLHPEVSIISKDGGARSDGHSDAATKSATVRL